MYASRIGQWEFNSDSGFGKMVIGQAKIGQVGDFRIRILQVHKEGQILCNMFTILKEKLYIIIHFSLHHTNK